MPNLLPFTEGEAERIKLDRDLFKLGKKYLHFKKEGGEVYSVSRSQPSTWERISINSKKGFDKVVLSDLEGREDGMWLFSRETGWKKEMIFI